MSKIKLHHGDCLEVMQQIPDNSIDLVLTDPPYLINYKAKYRKNKHHDFCSTIKNDDNEFIIVNSIKEIYRVLKYDSAAYIFCSPKNIDFFVKECKKYFKIKNIICWVKNNWTAGDLEAQFGHKYEMILLLNKGRKNFNGKRISDVWFFDRVSGKKQIHQNQKPIDLLRQCIEKHSSEGDIVLDPFMGSGSTGVACKNLNRNFIGIELEEKYFNIAKSRINDQETTETSIQ